MKKITNKKPKFSFNFFENLKKKICTQVIIVLGSIMRWCGGKDMQNALKKYNDERFDGYKYRQLMSQKEQLEAFIQQIIDQNLKSKDIQNKAKNMILDVNINISQGNYTKAQLIIFELSQMMEIDNQFDNFGDLKWQNFQYMF